MALKQTNSLDNLQPAIPLGRLLTGLLFVVLGVLTVTVVLPTWWPALSQSLLGEQPKAFWYLSRSSAFAAFGLLWLSMIFGLLITNKLARLWPGGPTAFDLHQYTSLLGIGFSLFHALVLIGDHYINYTWWQLLLPFASSNYRQFSVGLGQLSLYLAFLVSITFYLRRTITQRVWRLLHFLSFALFLLALAHGVWSGTDATGLWARSLYWGSGASVLFLTIYRIFGKQVVLTPAPVRV
jgi:predicted ferric reductase